MNHIDGLRVRARTFPLGQGYVDDYPVWDAAAGRPVVLQDTRTQSGVSSTTTFVYGLGLISMTDGAGATSYYLSDGLGSTTQLTDSAGAVTDTYAYDVFGAPRSVTGTTQNDFRYTAQQDDRNANRGLYYLRARAYDPSLGRFLQQDPLPLVQRYAYAGNNPVRFTDPSGLCVFGLPCPKPIEKAKDCVADPVECGKGAAEKAADAGRKVIGAADYCLSSAHLLECYERFELATVGVAVTEFGFTIGVGGCAVIAPIVGAATAVIGGVATCGLALTAGGIVAGGGVLITYHAFTPWHEGTNTTSSGTPAKPDKEQGATQ